MITACHSFTLTLLFVVALIVSDCFTAVQAVPLKRQSINRLAQNQVSTFRPYTFYAAAAYCSPPTTLSWSCGTNCNANSGFKPLASGGDGFVEQFWFVGFDPTLNSVIVGHQGTKLENILPLIEDMDIDLEPLGNSLFPGISSSIEVHNGFREAHARSAADVLSAVQTTLTRYNTNHITLVGHSLGGAIALLDAIYLSLHLPSSTFKTVLYGLPRIGNQAFANYVDAHVTSLTRINNKEDPVPILPGRFLGYHHPSGEIHIDSAGAWMTCQGQDNSNKECEVGAVPNVFVSDEGDHDGPYDGVKIIC